MAAKGPPGKEAPVLRGSPRGLTGIVRLQEREAVAAALELPELSLDPSYVAVAEMEGPQGERMAHFRVGVPKTTPPGTYQAFVPVGKDAHRIVLEVEPRARVKVSPRRLTLRADPDQVVSTTVSVSNVGNVAVEIPSGVRFGLFHLFGVDAAIGRALTATPADGERRLDVLMEEFAREHGGLVTGRLDGAGELLPGDVSEAGLEFTVPARLARGRTYYAVVRLPGGRFKLRIETLEKSPPRRVRKASA